MSTKLMVDKLVSEEVESVDGTGYNDFPKGWRRISLKTFLRSKFFIYSPEYIDFRQMVPKTKRQKKVNDGMIVSAKLFWYYDNTGLTWVGDITKNTLKFYAFGCKHKWGGTFTDEEKKIVPPGPCIHACKCSKCGHFEWHDSSG